MVNVAKYPLNFKSALNLQHINKYLRYSFLEMRITVFLWKTMGKDLSISLDFENASTAVKCSNSIQGSFNNDRSRCIPGAVFFALER